MNVRKSLNIKRKVPYMIFLADVTDEIKKDMKEKHLGISSSIVQYSDLKSLCNGKFQSTYIDSNVYVSNLLTISSSPPVRL